MKSISLNEALEKRPGKYEDEILGQASADWKDSPHEVLICIDGQLKQFGLEIVEIDTGSDYAWFIQWRN